MQRLKNQTLTSENLLLTLPARFAKQLQPEQGITGKQTIQENKMRKLSLEKMERVEGGNMPCLNVLADGRFFFQVWAQAPRKV